MEKKSSANVVEELNKARRFAARLAREIDLKNQTSLEMGRKHDEYSAALRRISSERDRVRLSYDEGKLIRYFKCITLSRFPSKLNQREFFFFSSESFCICAWLKILAEIC